MRSGVDNSLCQQMWEMGNLILFGACFTCWAFLCSDPFLWPRWAKTLGCEIFSSWCFVLSERGSGRRALWAFKMPAVFSCGPLHPCAVPPGDLHAWQIRSVPRLSVFLLQNGESWAEGPCRECECRDAVVTCFQRSCPPCPPGSRPLEAKGDCCPRCQPGTEPGLSLLPSGIPAASTPPASVWSPRGILSCLQFSVAN